MKRVFMTIFLLSLLTSMAEEQSERRLLNCQKAALHP